MQTNNFPNIVPALCETPQSHMSSKEFQRTLYNWLEEKGLVADLRSYLRYLMISELRNTTVGKVDSRTNFSLTKQAFSLIVAEHLLREGCHYTLSIFSTEVPGVANQLPFSLFEAHSQSQSWRFDQESLVNVLELIGISKGSQEGLKVASLYFKNEASLLSCLVAGKSVKPEVIQVESDENYLENVLRALGVPPTMILNIKSKIEESYLERIPQERRQFEELKEIVDERNRQIKLLLDEQLSLQRDNKKLKYELKESQKKLKQAILKEQNFNLRETQIQEKLDEVTRLKRGLEKTNRDKPEICSLKHCTDSCQALIGSNEELRKEVEKLEQLNHEKTQEIERQNIKLSSLTKDLQNSKLNINFLNTCLVRSSQLNLQQGDDPICSSSDSSETFTGEIIKQVRSRLLELEKESEMLDSKFRKLKMHSFVKK